MTKQTIIEAAIAACHVEGIEEFEYPLGYEFSWVDDADRVINGIKKHHPTARWTCFSNFKLFGASKDASCKRCLIKRKEGGWLYFNIR